MRCAASTGLPTTFRANHRQRLSGSDANLRAAELLPNIVRVTRRSRAARLNGASWAAKSRVLSAWALLPLLVCSTGCATMGLRAAVDMKVEAAPQSPPDALVYIDDQYIGS